MMEEAIRLTIGGLTLGAIYALSALGLVVIHKATRHVNFAHGAFIMLGAYCAWMLATRAGLPQWLVYLAAPIAVGLFAALLEAGILRRLRHGDPFGAVIATVFVGVAIIDIGRHVFGSDLLPVASPVDRFAPIEIGPLYLTPVAAWTIGGALLAAIVCAGLFARARLGLGMRAMASNSRGAQICGFGVDTVFAQAWFFAGFVAGLAGVFVAPLLGASPELGDSALAAAFVAAVLGGFDSLLGAVIGGLLLGLIETFAGGYISSAAQNAVSFILLIAVLMFRPDGIFAAPKTRAA